MVRAVPRAERGDEHYPKILGDNSVLEPSEYFPHEPLRPVSPARLSYSSACYEPGMQALALASEVIDDDLPPGFFHTFAINKTELPIASECFCCHTGPTRGQTARRFLPLALLLFRTIRPFLVLIRFRNPCVVFLLVLCGWNVRFMAVPSSMCVPAIPSTVLRCPLLYKIGIG